MDEKQRTKILGGVLAAVLLVGFVGPAVWNWVSKPVTDAAASLQAAERKLEVAEMQELQLLVAREHINQAQLASLPPNTLDAQRLYQEWITSLAQQCRFTISEVNPGVKPRALPGKYSAVSVEMEAETTLEGLARFLHVFEQADLLHRLDRLNIKSLGSQPGSRVEIQLTAQGLSVDGTPARLELFPRSELTQTLTADSTQLTVQNSEDFPEKTPFLARLGTEMIRVTDVNQDSWTIERGIEGTSAAEHAASTVVQYFPVAWENRNEEFDRYSELLAASPFAKPTPPRSYDPRLTSFSDKTIAPGETVQMTARAEDLNPEYGDAKFSLETEVEGLTINEQTGEIQWQTAEDLQPGQYTATVVATQTNNSETRVTKDFTVTVKRPNESPSLQAPAEAVVVLGREFILTVAAEDDGPPEQLSFALEGDSLPEGLAVDASSGTLKWQPPLTFKPGEYSVQVKVTDDGDPAKSASETVKLKVQDDSAVMTFLTGAVSRDGVMEAWFYNRAKDQQNKLRVGQPLNVDEIQAQIVDIGKRSVQLRDEQGLWSLALGRNLRERELIEPAAEPDAESTESAESPTAAADAAEAYEADPPAAADVTEPDAAAGTDAAAESEAVDETETPAEDSSEAAPVDTNPSETPDAVDNKSPAESTAT